MIENWIKIVQLYLEPHMILIKVNRLHSPLPTLQQTSASSSSACFSPQVITQIFTGNDCYCSPFPCSLFCWCSHMRVKQKLCVLYVLNCETKVATQLLNPFVGVILGVTFWSWIRVLSDSLWYQSGKIVWQAKLSFFIYIYLLSFIYNYLHMAYISLQFDDLFLTLFSFY